MLALSLTVALVLAGAATGGEAAYVNVLLRRGADVAALARVVGGEPVAIGPHFRALLRVPRARAAAAVAKLGDGVAVHVEDDVQLRALSLDAGDDNDGGGSVAAPTAARGACAVQRDADANLARISALNATAAAAQRRFAAPSSQRPTPVDVYVLGTGVLLEHVDFGGRARHGATFVSDEPAGDLNGHGTFIASLAVGTRYGAAKHADAISVKVLNMRGVGSTASVVRGLEWIVDAAAARPSRSPVALASIGGSASAVMDKAVAAAVDTGVFVVAGAGASAGDACAFSPGRVDTVFTASASRLEQQQAGVWRDVRIGSANFGRCVSAFAAAGNVRGAWLGSAPDERNASRVLSGGSAAAAFAAGTAAVVWGADEHRALPPAGVAAALGALAQMDRVALDCQALPAACKETRNALLSIEQLCDVD